MYTENLTGLAAQLAKASGYVPRDKRRMGEAINMATTFIIKSTVTDLTHNPHKIDRLNEKIETSLETLKNGSGRLHNDLTFFQLAADIDMRRNNIENKFKEYRKMTKIKSVALDTCNLEMLNIVNAQNRVELNIFDRKIAATPKGLRVEGINIKIFPDETNNIFIRLRELTSCEDKSMHICPQLAHLGMEPLREVDHSLLLDVKEYSLLIPLENSNIHEKTETILRVVRK